MKLLNVRIVKSKAIVHPKSKVVFRPEIINKVLKIRLDNGKVNVFTEDELKGNEKFKEILKQVK